MFYSATCSKHNVIKQNYCKKCGDFVARIRVNKEYLDVCVQTIIPSPGPTNVKFLQTTM